MRKSIICGFILYCFLIPSVWGISSGDPAAGWIFIHNGNSNQCHTIDIRGCETITIRFFHSYDRQWVEETFLPRQNGFLPHEVVYIDDTYDFRDQRYEGKITVGNRSIRISNIRNPKKNLQESIRARIAYTKPQQLIVKNVVGSLSIPFTDWGNPGDPIHMTIK
ncbi:hypothetical protein [Desulfobacula sp.]|uniref:hypothetical protein n=1 Tax=Desulfobacula sp. TaxID=2593537 RepID=UPI0026079CAC|nr:hypothetical protein [Desulfobacula sp.]